MLSTLIILLALIIIIALIYLASVDGEYHIHRSKLINTDLNTAFDKLRDFKSWPDWSPWLMHEPGTTLKYSNHCNEEGGFYTWDGQRVGAGKLGHEKFNRPKHIEQCLTFTRPFKSVCQVSFDLAEKDSQSEVTWSMHGKMPFLFRFMTQSTIDMISQDYDLGLAMLAGQLDPGAEHPQIQFVGETTLTPVHALCEGFSGSVTDMATAMQTGFPKLMAYLEETAGLITGEPLTAYHKVNLKTMQFVCDLAIPVEQGINPGSYQLKTLGGGRYYKVTVQGNYDFLALAWHSANAHVRMLKLKHDRQRCSLEIYENDPTTVSHSNEIQTSIYVPIR